MNEMQIILNGVAVNALSNGSNFDVRISREEAIRLLRLNCPLDIMCKEILWFEEDWVGMEGNGDDVEQNEDLQTFEIWLNPDEAEAQVGEINKLPPFVL